MKIDLIQHMDQVQQEENSLNGYLLDNWIEITRDHVLDDWYITVVGPTGCRDYDGWWPRSQGKPIHDALSEAVTGAMIDLPESWKDCES